MKNSQKSFIATLLLTLLVILIIGGVYAYVKNINSKATTKNTNIIVGNDRDSHGCIPRAGYSWCEIKNKCLRPWEEKCEATSTSSIEAEVATTTSCTSDKGKVMTYEKALEIAKTSSCAKIGVFTGEYGCNQNAGGLVDVYMKPSDHPNCGFSCRISIDAEKAEEGWMCTGAL